MAKFRDIKTFQKFASSHAVVHNLFNFERHLVSRIIYKKNRSAALAEWRIFAAYSLFSPPFQRRVAISLAAPRNAYVATGLLSERRRPF